VSNVSIDDQLLHLSCCKRKQNMAEKKLTLSFRFPVSTCHTVIMVPQKCVIMVITVPAHKIKWLTHSIISFASWMDCRASSLVVGEQCRRRAPSGETRQRIEQALRLGACFHAGPRLCYALIGPAQPVLYCWASSLALHRTLAFGHRQKSSLFYLLI
jgi:hypothetical protein